MPVVLCWTAGRASRSAGPSRLRWGLQAVLVASALMIGYDGVAVGGTEGQAMVLEAVGLVLLAGLLFPVLRNVRRGSGRPGARERATYDFRATVSQEGITISAGDTRTKLSWSAVTAVQETPRAFVLGISSGPAAVTLPKRGLIGGATVEDLRHLLKRMTADTGELIGAL